jgi:Patatin-like phospholipase
MPKRLAVTIAGAVSLGSYEAGVLWEVLDAIAQHNDHPETKPEEEVSIDVVTGASAGGMTAVILAQKLLYEGAAFVGPYNNPLYNTWVAGISLKELQDTGPLEDPLLSIFSSDLIEQISIESLIKGRYLNGENASRKPHPAAAGELRLGLALTNLNGLAYEYKVRPSGAFRYIDYSDQMTRRVTNDDDNTKFWEELRQGAVACGAFPFAFRTQPIQRFRKGADCDDYTSKTLVFPDGDPTFVYSDGGILQNQPLGMAKNLVDFLDNHRRQNERFYLFVSPHAKDPSPSTITAEETNYLKTFERIASLLMGQAGFQDWIQAMQINKDVRLLDERACQLLQALNDGTINAASLSATAEAILKLFFRDGTADTDSVETLEKARDRIEHQYAEEISQLKDKGMKDAFRDAILGFETAAQLGTRDVMTIYGITAHDGELAGGGLQAFLGFFDRRFRDHDYDMGRKNAQQVLLSLDDSKGSLGPLRYTPTKPMHEIDAELDGLRFSQLPEEDVQTFKAGLTKRMRQILHALHWEAADGLADFVVGRIIHHATAQPPLDQENPLGNLDEA